MNHPVFTTLSCFFPSIIVFEMLYVAVVHTDFQLKGEKSRGFIFTLNFYPKSRLYHVAQVCDTFTVRKTHSFPLLLTPATPHPKNAGLRLKRALAPSFLAVDAAPSSFG